MKAKLFYYLVLAPAICLLTPFVIFGEGSVSIIDKLQLKLDKMEEDS